MSTEGWRDLLTASRSRAGRTLLGEGVRCGAADLGRVRMHSFVSCVPGEHPKQPSNVESLLGFLGGVFAAILSPRPKKKKKSCRSVGKNRSSCQDMLFHLWNQCTARSCTTPQGFIDIKIPALLYLNALPRASLCL